ncbi:MAG: ribosome maturation factor RimP [Actinomycetes bacterium]
MSAQVSHGVSDLLSPVVADAGLVLENVTVTPAGRRRVVRVVVDLPEDATGALDLDCVAEVSRAVSDALDASDALGATPYVLEVSSPGVDRPLTERRHWARARGRLVRVPLLADGGQAELTGRVVGVDDAGVTFEVDGVPHVVGWQDLGRGQVQVEFSRADHDDAHEEDDAEGDESARADGEALT